MKPVLETKELTKIFAAEGKSDFTAVDHVNFQLYPGEILGIVGESGSGKSTLVRAVSRLTDVTEGSIFLVGQDITRIKGKALRQCYKKLQMVFQTPVTSFDPRRTLGDGIGESLRNSGTSKAEAKKEVLRLLSQCGPSEEFYGRYPHEVSGGQCQRAAIARALAVQPKIVICDEATSSLDVTVQQQILELLKKLKESPKPIVLTGAQRPIGFDSTDSKTNLADAFRCAAEDLPGVSIVFNSRVILGTRAKKTRSKSFQAFSSINHPELGVLRDGVLLRYIRQDCREAPVFYDRLDPRVALLKLVPGTGRDAADFLLERNDALIIESFGVGGLPEAGGFYDCVRRWMEAGRVVVLTTQVENEGSDLGVYHVGYRLKSDLGVLEAYDMTTEAVVAKLMWILGQTRRWEEVERLFYTPVARDILWPGL